MKNKNFVKAASILYNHRLNQKGMKKLPDDSLPKSIEDAYKIQYELKNLYLSLNNNYLIGKKVGCTNKIAQKQLNIFEPFYGNLFSKFSNINGCTLKSSKFFIPYIEPEISLQLKNDININDAPFMFDDANQIFDIALPSFEIVDFRFGENIKEVGINNLIASNGASEYHIKGENFIEINKIDLNNLEVKLFINDKMIEKGNTNLVLENPINSAIWLLNKLAQIGEPMLKGQIISTGTCTKAIRVEKNSSVRAEFQSLGSVEFQYI